MRRAHDKRLRAERDAAQQAAHDAEVRRAEREQMRSCALEQQWATVMDAAQANWRQVDAPRKLRSMDMTSCTWHVLSESSLQGNCQGIPKRCAAFLSGVRMRTASPPTSRALTGSI